MRQKRHFHAIVLVALLILAGCTTAAWAHQAVAVIPLMSAAKPLQNIVTVAKSGGDFTDPVAAVASITDANENNPYLVYIAPGDYPLTQTLVMKPFVDLRGSGRLATTLSGAISTADPLTSAIVKLANSSVLASLAIGNEGGGAFSVGIASDTPPVSVVDHPFVKQVTIVASGAATNVGAAFKTAKVSIEGADISTEGGNISLGILAEENSELLIKNTVIAVINGTANIAVNIGNSAASLDSVTASASGGIDHKALSVTVAGAGSYEILVKDSLLLAGDGVDDQQNYALDLLGPVDAHLLRVEVIAKPTSAGSASESIGLRMHSMNELLIVSSDISGASKSLEMEGQSVAVNKSSLIGAVMFATTYSSTVFHSLIGGNVITAGTDLEFYHVYQKGTNDGTGDFNAANSVLSEPPTRGGTDILHCVNSSYGFFPLDNSCIASAPIP